MSGQTEYPAIAYQLVVQNNEQGESAKEMEENQAEQAALEQELELIHLPENQEIIYQSSKYVECFLLCQVVLVFLLLLRGFWHPIFYLHLLVVFFGWLGVRNQQLCFLIIHFVYSVLCMVGLFFLFYLGISFVSSWPSLAILLTATFLVSIFLRQERLLIQALCAPKVPAFGDLEDPMVVELPSESPSVPPATTTAASQPEPIGWPHPAFGPYPNHQSVPMIVQTDSGHYMLPDMPNPQFVLTAVPSAPTVTDIQQETLKDTQH